MNDIWIVGTSGFAIDIGARFKNVPGTGNFFMGYIDDREENRDECKQMLKKWRMQQDVISPNSINLKDKKNRFLLGVSDPSFKSNFINGKEIDYEQIHDFRVDVNFPELGDIKDGIFFYCKVSNLTSIGYGNFIDSQSIIGHNSTIGDFNHIGVNVIVNGDCNIGNRNYIHPSTVIGKGITIGDDCVIGAGSVVLRNVPSGSKIIAPAAIKL